MPDRTLIAVVDDDPGWLGLLGTMLADHGFHALLIGDPRSAREQITLGDPAVAVVSDLALARELRSALGEEGPALLLITADLAELGEEDASLFQAAYEKPASLTRILAEVRRAARGRRASGTLRKAEPELAADRKKIIER